MDSLRPDFLSCYGYEKETSPNIDRLAQEGVLFKNAFAQATWTRPSGLSLLTSTYPSVHTILTHADILPINIPTLQEVLEKNGFETIAISAMANISPYFGFDKGFKQFIQLFKEEWVIKKNLVWKANKIPIPTSEDINEALFSFLQKNGKKNAFIFVWSVDTHAPYFHRNTQMAKFCFEHRIFRVKDVIKMHMKEEIDCLNGIYEDMIFYNDFYFGELLKKLKEMDIFDKTFFILTSDHGEAFGEHGFYAHEREPYDELIRVPLIIKFPASQYRGEVYDLVQHIDLAPTILEYASINGDEMWAQGNSIIPTVRDHLKINDFVLAEFQLKPIYPKYVALRTKDYKYIEIRPGTFALQRSIFRTFSPLFRSIFKKRFLFDIKEDPGEKINIAGKKKDIACHFQSSLKKILKENRMILVDLKNKKREKFQMDIDVANQLRILGYFDERKQ